MCIRDRCSAAEWTLHQPGQEIRHLLPLSIRCSSSHQEWECLKVKSRVRPQVPHALLPSPRPAPHPHITPHSHPLAEAYIVDSGKLESRAPHTADGWEMLASPKRWNLHSGMWDPQPLSPHSPSDTGSLTCTPPGRSLEHPPWVSGQLGARTSRLRH